MKTYTTTVSTTGAGMELNFDVECTCCWHPVHVTTTNWRGMANVQCEACGQLMAVEYAVYDADTLGVTVYKFVAAYDMDYAREGGDK